MEGPGNVKILFVAGFGPNRSRHGRESQALRRSAQYPVHGELLNWAKNQGFFGFDTVPGCVISSSFSFI